MAPVLSKRFVKRCAVARQGEAVGVFEKVRDKTGAQWRQLERQQNISLVGIT
jgi:hypothetical protein